MTSQLDSLALRLLDALQREIPLVERPFAEIARRLETSERDVLDRVASLRAREGGVIRQISAIFDSKALGYCSSLVAVRVDESRIDDAAAAISAHPGVSHNYRRDHAYNLWYTIALPPDSRLGLDETVAQLHEQSGARQTRLMPALKTYKIGVKFNLSGDAGPGDRVGPATALRGPATRFCASARDKQMIRVLQQDLPLVPRPFDAWAREAGVNVAELVRSAESYIETGVMRRFSAVLRHREAGFSANAMGAWVVPQDKHDEFGTTAASFAAVSHCYLRPTYEDWPYSIFTMVHGTQRAECEKVLAEISRQTGISDYASLYSTHEYKKVRVKYFTDDVEQWERQCLPAT